MLVAMCHALHIAWSWHCIAIRLRCMRDCKLWALELEDTMYNDKKIIILIFREEVGLNGSFRLDSPATSERILECLDHNLSGIVSVFGEKLGMSSWKSQIKENWNTGTNLCQFVYYDNFLTLVWGQAQQPLRHRSFPSMFSVFRSHSYFFFPLTICPNWTNHTQWTTSGNHLPYLPTSLTSRDHGLLGLSMVQIF